VDAAIAQYKAAEAIGRESLEFLSAWQQARTLYEQMKQLGDQIYDNTGLINTRLLEHQFRLSQNTGILDELNAEYEEWFQGMLRAQRKRGDGRGTVSAWRVRSI